MHTVCYIVGRRFQHTTVVNPLEITGRSPMRKIPILFLVAALALVGMFSLSSAKPVRAQSDALIIESWRNDDLSIWRDTIIPAFNAKYPDIQVEFQPSPPADYNAL